MSTVNTKIWMDRFIEKCRKQKGFLKQPDILQRELICKPLQNFFPERPIEEIQYLLLPYGLFKAKEWRQLHDTLMQMENNKIWNIVEQEIKYLKRIWKGPNVPVFIFPITNAHLSAERRLFRKNGVAFEQALFLFVAPDLSENEIKALLAHEYNHLCRLGKIKQSMDELTLEESVIIEGLGEYAVQELYGKAYLAPWISLYSEDRAFHVWKNHFISNLKLKGQEKHHIYLYGKRGSMIPKWMGYAIGYKIVTSFMNNNTSLSLEDVLSLDAKTIISDSDFVY